MERTFCRLTRFDLKTRSRGIMQAKMSDANTFELVVFQIVDTPIGGDVDVAGFHGSPGKIGIVLKEVELAIHFRGHQVSIQQKIAHFQSLAAVLMKCDVLLKKAVASFARDG